MRAMVDVGRLVSPGRLTVMGGWPGTGKTMAAHQLAREFAVEHRIRTLLFSTEISREEVCRRLACGLAGVPWSMGRNSDGEVHAAAREVSESPLYVWDTHGVGLAELERVARWTWNLLDVACVIVDYVDLVDVPQSRTPQERFRAVGQVLRSVTRELGVSSLAVCQLRRTSSVGAYERPSVENLPGSGALAEASDSIVLIHHPGIGARTDTSIEVIDGGTEG